MKRITAFKTKGWNIVIYLDFSDWSSWAYSLLNGKHGRLNMYFFGYATISCKEMRETPGVRESIYTHNVFGKNLDDRLIYSDED
jgi:hypothetical protein